MSTLKVGEIKHESFTGTTQLKLDSAGRLLVGTTTEGHAAADNLTIADTGNSGITIRSGSSNNGALYFSDGTSGSAEYKGAVRYVHADNALGFYTNGSQNVLVNSSGDVGIGTSTINRGSHSKTLTVSNTGTGARSAVEIEGNTANAHGVLEFYNNGTLVSGLNSRGSDRLQFVTGSSGTVRGQFTSNGLNFGSDTAAANALDDYEEGTWTPYFFCTNNSQTVSYSSSAHAGHYTKIGNKVFATFRMFWSSKSGNGNFNVGNLPFTSSSDTNISQPSGFTSHYFSGMGSNNITGYLLNNSTQVRIGYHSNGGFINQNFSNLSSSGEYNGHITYYVN